MARIALDIDQTLYSFDSAFRNAIFDIADERDDKSILRMAYSNNFEWRNLVDHDKKLAYEAIERVHQKARFQEPFIDAVDTVCLLDAEGHGLVYIGSRFARHQDNTEQWLYRQGFPQWENVICANPTESKLKHIEDCQYLIDDRPKTILEFLHDQKWTYEHEYTGPIKKEDERKAFALWMPYNQNLTEVRNLYLAPTWRGLRYYLNRKGVIS